MSAVPPVSRRVLDALHPGTAGAGLACETSTPVARAFVRLETALDAHTAALAALDPIEAAVVAAYGYPRVPLPDTAGPPAYAADPATIVRRLGPGPAARRLTAELRRRQAVFARAAAAAGPIPARAREARTARELSDAAGYLLLAPVETRGDLALELAVLIAAGEATADDAAAFPWVHLRALHADLHGAQPTR
ncbi:protein of unknown function [Methylorubrum extorquens DM4]|uniref:Uncharacterized protein n=1 Tax=Methylorubrum extorquens (strain DSM 6343 / CIP 106787 / DM4) TaxID=661410 RepID=A0A2P9HAX0_METED|nr:hypothetical protein [Methylorubrum extorquens]SPK02041.1 protein of unknown function [Methylorubrum extorquens DM4]